MSGVLLYTFWVDMEVIVHMRVSAVLILFQRTTYGMMDAFFPFQLPNSTLPEQIEHISLLRARSHSLNLVGPGIKVQVQRDLPAQHY